MKDQPTVSLWLDLDTTLRVLDQLYGQAIESLEISVIEWYVLRSLYDQDGQRPSDLARVVGRPPTSFTPILDEIEAKGLIERRASPSDRRSVHIHLTEAGKRLSKPVQKTADRIESRLRSAIPDDRRTEFASLLLALQQPVRDQK